MRAGNLAYFGHADFQSCLRCWIKCAICTTKTTLTSQGSQVQSLPRPPLKTPPTLWVDGVFICQIEPARPIGLGTKCRFLPLPLARKAVESAWASCRERQIGEGAVSVSSADDTTLWQGALASSPSEDVGARPSGTSYRLICEERLCQKHRFAAAALHDSVRARGRPTPRIRFGPSADVPFWRIQQQVA
jgi:hypothetical protein